MLKPGGRLLWHMEHPITYCIEEDENGLQIIDNYNVPNTEICDSFGGTPLARRHGGFHVDLQTAQHFWRISDILNAVCNAGFRILKTHESSDHTSDDSLMKKMPDSFAVLAVK